MPPRPLLHRPLSRLLPLVGALVSLPAQSQSTAEPPAPSPTRPSTGEARALGEVVVRGQRLSEVEERRFATASKQVFGREDLDRYGDSSLGDVIKRLPGVTLAGTPGRGGDIRMRGLGNGYTLILLNGEPAPRGFSLDSLAPEQVERIEIMRAPVAEHSARAIAGIINIVLRETFVRKGSEARPTLGWEQGRPQPSLSLQHSDRTDTVSYDLNANVFHRNLGNATETTTTDLSGGLPRRIQIVDSQTRNVTDGMHLSGRFNWKLAGSNGFALMPFLNQSRSTGFGSGRLDQPLGITPPSYAAANWRNDSDSSMARLMGFWRHRLAGGDRLELRFNGGLADSHSRNDRQEFDTGGAPTHRTLATTGIRDDSFSSSAKYAISLGRGHSVALGGELERGQRDENAATLQDGVPQLTQFGTRLSAETRRLALYGQDEWELSPLWSAYAGLRWESIRTHSRWSNNAIGNDSSVLSPLLHSVWRFSEESKDQLRLSLTRAYKAPTLTQLVPRPTLAAAYPTAAANIPTSPDSAGNPALQPELAWGLDLAFEHYLDQGGVLGANLFRRNIDHLIRNVTTLETVSWSPVQRWVSTPQNLGKAVTQGIELEAKFRLGELWTGAPPVDLRANLSRFWSHVAQVPGPNNRLDQQPGLSANLGADYRFRSLPLTLGGNLNWTPAYTVQQSDSQTYYQGLKRVYDLYALWRLDPDMQVRLSVANLLHADYDTANGHASAIATQWADTMTKTYLSWSARLEVKF